MFYFENFLRIYEDAYFKDGCVYGFKHFLIYILRPMMRQSIENA